MRLVAACALLLAAAPASAGKLVENELLGWTKDGVYFAYLEAPQFPQMPDGPDDQGATLQFATVLDGRTGMVVERFIVRVDGKPSKDDKKAMAGLRDKAAFDAWKAAHPTSCSTAITAPDGQAHADVKVSGKGVHGKWKKNRFEYGWEGDDFAEEKQAFFTLGVQRDGKTIQSASAATNQSMAAQGAALSGSVSLCWSPDSRRVLWSVKRQPGMMRDEGDEKLLVGPTGTPRIQLVADKSVLVKVAAAVGAVLDQAGFTPTDSKASNEKTPRPATVIYAAAGFEEIAKKVAAAVPGGATVAALDWKAPFDVIVGIGATALK
jgi:hypothetical protein